MIAIVVVVIVVMMMISDSKKSENDSMGSTRSQLVKMINIIIVTLLLSLKYHDIIIIMNMLLISLFLSSLQQGNHVYRQCLIRILQDLQSRNIRIVHNHRWIPKKPFQYSRSGIGKEDSFRDKNHRVDQLFFRICS